MSVGPHQTTDPQPGDVTEARLARVQVEWRATSAQIAHHQMEATRLQAVYRKLAIELLSLEDAFPVDWS